MVRNEKYLIYRVENTITNEIYIGATKRDIETRKYSHEYEAAKKPISKFHKSISEYGKDNFKWEVIDSAENKPEAIEKETIYIDKYLAFYIGLNKNKGGQGLLGRTHSDETKQKMREKKLGIPKSDHHRKMMSIATKGKHAGELHGRSKLNDEKVRQIRRLLSDTKMTQEEISKFFNVSSSTISCIKRKSTWQHVS